MFQRHVGLHGGADPVGGGGVHPEPRGGPLQLQTQLPHQGGVRYSLLIGPHSAHSSGRGQVLASHWPTLSSLIKEGIRYSNSLLIGPNLAHSSGRDTVCVYSPYGAETPSPVYGGVCVVCMYVCDCVCVCMVCVCVVCVCARCMPFPCALPG